MSAVLRSASDGIRRFAAGGIASAVVLLLAANAAHAIPVEWTLNNWQTNGGVSVTGSFWFDDATDTFSNISVSDSTGNDYGFVGPNADSQLVQFVIDDPSNSALGGTPTVFGDLEIPGLTMLGGTVNLEFTPNSTVATCLNADCQTAGGSDNLFSGTLTGTVVPEPSTAAIMTLGLVGLAARRRFRGPASTARRAGLPA